MVDCEVWWQYFLSFEKLESRHGLFACRMAGPTWADLLHNLFVQSIMTN